MLERTAGCLESGSLRRLLPGPRKSLKSRRMLHSSFWNHGAGELEISPLWAVLVHGSESSCEQNEKSFKPVEASPSNCHFLDFLYPSNAIKLAQQYSSWDPERYVSQRARNNFARLGLRLYTSAATERPAVCRRTITSSAQNCAHETGKDTIYSEQNNSNPSLSGGLLKDLISSDDKNRFEEAWRQYQLGDPNHHWLLIPQLLSLFETSSRTVDAERSVTIFHELNPTLADEQAFRAVIRAYLTRQGGEAKACELYRLALAKFGEPVATDILLSHFIDRSQWKLANETWSEFQNLLSINPKMKINIWAMVDRLPGLADRVISLAEYVNSQLEEISDETDASNKSKLSLFAIAVAKRALLLRDVGPLFEESKYRAILKVVQNWNADSDDLYETYMSALLGMNQKKLVIQAYRKYRQRVSGKISRPILDAVLRIACTYHSVAGMQQVLDDWFRFYGQPSTATYRSCMGEFASQGDLDTVKALLDQYLIKVKQFAAGIRNADDLAPLLHVHAKRGEIAEVVRIFDEIEDKYHVKPTLKCWNILLSAYGKVHDVDSAFVTFQKLLDSSLEPDHYTFATMMGICATRGDLHEALDLYQLAETRGVRKTTAMVDCLVLLHLRDNQFRKAETICEDAIHMKLKGSLTRMWNYLLSAYAMKRDLENTNRLLRRMKAAGVDYDGFTYSALMQALAMVKQPSQAMVILNEVMPDAGICATEFHYAVVMGGFLATGELDKLFQVHHQMLNRKIRNSVSTRRAALKARAIEDQKFLQNGSEQVRLAKAEDYFFEAYNTMDAREIASTARKGDGGQPLDVAYSSAYFDYLMFVYGTYGAHDRVRQLYEQHMVLLPEQRRGEPSMKILSAMMTSHLHEKNFDEVQKCWDMAFSQAKKQGKSIRKDELLRYHRLALCLPLPAQMLSLSRQGKVDQLSETVEQLLAAGFELDNKNWNLYIQLLTNGYKYKKAFELCEMMLMDGWTGWARLRWKEPRRNRLQLDLRRERKDARYLRPIYHTVLYLARAYLELNGAAAESRSAQFVLNDLLLTCPRTLNIVSTMQRTDDDLEREVLRL